MCDSDKEKSKRKFSSPTVSHTPTKNEIASENNVYVVQLQELARHFSSIKNSGICQYGINLMRELTKCKTEEKAKVYALKMMG